MVRCTGSQTKNPAVRQGLGRRVVLLNDRLPYRLVGMVMLIMAMVRAVVMVSIPKYSVNFNIPRQNGKPSEGFDHRLASRQGPSLFPIIRPAQVLRHPSLETPS